MRNLIGLAIDAAIWASIYYGFIVGNEYAGNLALFVLWVLGALSIVVSITAVCADSETQEKVGRSFLETPKAFQIIGRTSAFVRFFVMGALGFHAIAFFLCACFMFGVVAKQVCVNEAKARALKV